MGAGREDLLDGEIVDPNTGQTQEILVSNNEHVIPEYTLFALGGGDTEKGQKMMDKLRADTKPQAEAMGYDFQGAEDGSMNYAPVMAQDGKGTSDSAILTGQETGETIGEVAARPKKPNEVDRQQIYVEVMNFVDGKISEDEFFNKTGFYLPQINGVRGGGNFGQVFNTLMKDLDKRGYTGLAGTSLLPPAMQDGKQTAMPGPGMNIQEIVKKMMAQGKSIEEIMSIMSKLNLGMPRQRMPMTAQDGMPTEEVNGLKKLEMQDGNMTSGLGRVMEDLDMANMVVRNM
jgi:hypothetical protein